MKTTHTITRMHAWVAPCSRVTRKVATIAIFSCFIILINVNRSVQGFIVLDDSSSLVTQPQSYAAARKVSRWASGSSRHEAKISNIEAAGRLEGIMSDKEFERLVRVDKTIRALQMQLPTILTKPLTPAVAEDVYAKDNFCFSVLVDDTNVNDGNDVVYLPDSNSKNDDSIVIMRSRDELTALSDVLVLATGVAQQAALVTGTSDSKVSIECQLIIDENCGVIRIPWRAKAPAFGSLATTENSNKFNNLEGVTDCYLGTDDEADNDVGKVKQFVVRKSSFNGRTLNGPTIGQAFKSVQSTVTNLQQNPILQNIVRTTQQQDGENKRGNNIFNSLRDELLGQAATVVSARLSSDTAGSSNSEAPEPISVVPVFQVEAIGELPITINDVWIDEESIATDENTASDQSKIGTISSPCPGTDNWEKFVASRSCLLRFANDIIPQLSDLSIIDPKLFAEDAMYKLATDESVLMTGRESLANFFQSMALTRKGTGATWEMNRCQVIDWENRTVAVTYEATTGSLPLWKIHGRDVYKLDTITSKDERPVVQEIQQGKMIAKGPNGNEIQLDGGWFVENVVNAFQVDGGFSGTNLPRDFLTELLMNQPSLSPLLGQKKPANGKSAGSRRKMSESAAASSYYAMADLYEQGLSLFDMSSTARRSAPGIEYMSENVELKGYLGEPIIRGSALYSRSLGSVISGIRESIRQKRLLIEDTPVPPRVELQVPTEEICLSLTYLFRIPAPGVGILPSSDSNSPAPSLPLKIELTSNYKIDPDTGLIIEHRLVETRINGQLTPGDQVSRWMRRSLNLDGGTGTTRNEDGAFKAISDALSWFRTM